MSHRCDNCKYQFKSEYLLNKHLNKKIPCNVILKCDRCNRIFKNDYELDRHKNKKYPCVDVNRKSDLEIKLEIEKIKATSLEAIKKMELEAKLAIIHEKNNKQMEKMELENKLLQERSKEQKELEFKNKLALIQEKSNKQLEIEERRRERILEQEQEKTKRKEITTAIANKNAAKAAEEKELAIRNKFLDHIKGYQKINKYPFDCNTMQRLFVNYIEDDEKLEQIIDYIKNNTIHDIRIFIHKLLLNNESMPESKSLFYSTELDEYWGIVPIKGKGVAGNYNKEKETVIKQLNFWSNVIRTVIIGQSFGINELSNRIDKMSVKEQSIVKYNPENERKFHEYYKNYSKYDPLTHDGQLIIDELAELDKTDPNYIEVRKTEDKMIRDYYEYRDILTKSVSVEA